MGKECIKAVYCHAAYLTSMQSSGGGGLFAKYCPTLMTPWTVAHQTPLSWDFPRRDT